MKTTERFTFRLKKRYAKIIHDIAKAFYDPDLDDPYRGAKTRALEHILQYYSTTEDCLRYAGIDKKRLKFFIEEDRELVESIINA